MEQYAVFGHPIQHSRSPFIHQQFARQTGQAVSYRAILAPLEGFADAVAQFHQQGGKGANVTMPFKEEAYRLCHHLTDRARRAGAVNTLWWDNNGALWGDTTDGAGLVADLLAAGVVLQHRRILVLGAGGAVRGVLQPLLDKQPTELVLANRTAEKARLLAADFADLGKVQGGGFADIDGSFDLVINGTPASMGGSLPDLSRVTLAPGAACYDMAYGAGQTLFQQWAEREGAKINLAGLGMLVRQAAESFNQWRRVAPDANPVLQALKAELEGKA
ncbi:shikimate dehydrogenase [Ferrimonas marina]|uniref:Shikimate dehydrogenase (NADP(+)) n=1 Tax=Ferrimonas marina TaxID=299255 RepID=A0A1M5ZH13_9GAMM|nr:shikimate dehydrogenase [Ferrimonas marina]SHI23556.1 shikimate dehydrogenase [Ferrimonas marina]